MTAQIQFKLAINNSPAKKHLIGLEEFQSIKERLNTHHKQVVLEIDSDEDDSQLVAIQSADSDIWTGTLVSSSVAIRKEKRDIVILVVDDDPDIVDLIDEGFREQDIKVIKALGVKEVLEHIGKHYFDIVLVDIYMKPFSGLDLLSMISTKHYSTMIAMSGKEDGAEMANQKGFANFIKKPVEMEKLIEICLEELSNGYSYKKIIPV